jgi:hypothetical protein
MRRTLAVALVCSLIAQSVLAQDMGHRLPDGTKVPLRLMETISSGTAKDGDAVNFTVVEDIMTDGEVVIKQGTPVRGVIVQAQGKRRMGRAGKLSYTVTETKSVDRQTIRLRATQQKSGDSHATSVAVTTTAVAVFVPVAAPFFLLRKGKDIVVAEGTRVDAFVDGEHLLASVSPQPSPSTKETPTANGKIITNEDILSLHGAGFGDDLIIAKIKASSHQFNVEADELVRLKSAGISERVLTAMLNGGSR